MWNRSCWKSSIGQIGITDGCIIVISNFVTHIQYRVCLSNRDSIRAAARYLKANGAPGNMANALFRYNQSQRYVRAVTAYAEVMRADANAYRGYYHWQVYYLTTGGDNLLAVGYGS